MSSRVFLAVFTVLTGIAAVFWFINNERSSTEGLSAPPQPIAVAEPSSPTIEHGGQNPELHASSEDRVAQVNSEAATQITGETRDEVKTRSIEGEARYRAIDEALLGNLYTFNGYLETLYDDPSSMPAADAANLKALKETLDELIDYEVSSADIDCNNGICVADVFTKSSEALALSRRIKHNWPANDDFLEARTMEAQGQSYYRYYFISADLDVDRMQEYMSSR